MNRTYRLKHETSLGWETVRTLEILPDGLPILDGACITRGHAADVLADWRRWQHRSRVTWVARDVTSEETVAELPDGRLRVTRAAPFSCAVCDSLITDGIDNLGTVVCDGCDVELRRAPVSR